MLLFSWDGWILENLLEDRELMLLSKLKDSVFLSILADEDVTVHHPLHRSLEMVFV